MVSQVEQDFLQRLIDTLDGHYRKLHDALSESWSDVDEHRFLDVATTLTLQPQSENAFRVEQILGYVAAPANQGGLIELGNEYKFVVAANTPFAFGCKIRLNNTDQRVLSVVTVANGLPGARGSGTAGLLFLHLGGKEIPPGALRW